MTDGFFHDPGFGAQHGADGATRFRFFAPACRSVVIDVEGGAAVTMQEAGGGWFESVEALPAGARYRYRLDGDRAVPDPASRFQPDGVHGPSEVVDPRAYAWRNAGWRGRPWHEVVLLELHVAAYGGYAGVRAQLPRLAADGITAIELMPLAEVPGSRNWGYDGVLPYAPHAALGRPEDLKALVDAAHDHGLMVFLDVVYNHFGPEGNHLRSYAPTFFRDDLHTPWGAAIDFQRREVRQFFIGNALYWIDEYRFDGLRFDAVHAIADDTFVAELGAAVRGRVDPARHVHLVLENERNEAAHIGYARGHEVPPAFDAQWNDDVHNVLHVLLTGEHEGYYASYREAPAGKLARALGQGFVYQGDALPGEGDAHPPRTRGTPSGHLPPTAFVFFLQNHDQVGNRAFGERLVRLAEPDALRAAVALQLLCPQIPLLFMGEEWGCPTPFLFFTDFHEGLAVAVREGRRKEFSRFAAFRDDATRETIPDPNAEATFRHSCPDPAQMDQPSHAAHRALVRRLLELRRTMIVPRLAGARSAGAQAIGPAAVQAAWTLGDGARLEIVTNLGGDALDIATPPGALLIETRGGTDLARIDARSTRAWFHAGEVG